MELKVIRTDFGEEQTIGRLYINNKYFCDTLEDKVRNPGVKVPAKTAIPYGKYEVIINESTRFKKELPLLLNVPGFSGVRIHSGNTDEDTEGCILVGTKRGNIVVNSRAKFNIVFAELQKARQTNEKIFILVTKGFEQNIIT